MEALEGPFWVEVWGEIDGGLSLREREREMG